MENATYHYVVSNLGGRVLAVYGSALRDMAFDHVAKQLAQGNLCAVVTKAGERLAIGAKFNA